MDIDTLTVAQLKFELSKLGVEAPKYLRKKEYQQLLRSELDVDFAETKARTKAKAEAVNVNVSDRTRVRTESRAAAKAAEGERPVKVSRLVVFLRAHIANVCLVFVSLLALVAYYKPYDYGHFFVLAFKLEGGLYSHGWEDLYLICTITLIVTYLRHMVQSYYLDPLARALGVRDPEIILKFKEAGWFGHYYVLSFTFGVWLMTVDGGYFSWGAPDAFLGVRLDWLWAGYPQIPVTAMTKVYHLVQLSMWIHCLIVIHVERKRKDYLQMLFHHIVTIILVGGAWFNGYTHAGVLFMTNLDLADIFLYNMKCMNYVGGRWKTASDLTFILFMSSWLVTRHAIFLAVVHSYWARSDALIDTPALRPEWHKPVFTSAFLLLQGIIILWLVLIVRLAYQFLTTKEHIDDTRSEVDSDSESEE